MAGGQERCLALIVVSSGDQGVLRYKNADTTDVSIPLRTRAWGKGELQVH
jgi:hypothetical protein